MPRKSRIFGQTKNVGLQNSAKLFTHSARAPPAKSHARCSWQNLCKGLKGCLKKIAGNQQVASFFGLQKKYFEEFYLIHLFSFFYIQQFQVARVFALQLSMLSQGNFTLFAQSELKL